MKNVGSTLLFRIIPVTAAILIIMEIILVNTAAGSGAKVLAIDESISSLAQENSFLEQNIASASSLMTIAAKSQEVGFVTPQKTQFVTIVPGELPVAYQASIH